MSDDASGALKLPTIAPSRWVGAVLLRAGLPFALMLLLLSGGSVQWNAVVASMPYAANAVFLLVALWMLHWYYAAWKEANDSALASRRILLWGIRTAFFFLLVAALVRFFCFVVSAASEGALGTGDELTGACFGEMFALGLLPSFALLALIRLAHLAYNRAVAEMEPSEALWWVDAVVRIARAAAICFALLALGASYTLIVLHADGSLPFFFDASSWWDGTLSLVGDLADSGMIAVFAAFAAFKTLASRFMLWSDVRSNRCGMDDAAVVWSRKAVFVVKVVVYVVLLLAFVSSLIALMSAHHLAAQDGLALPASQIFELLREALLPPAIIVPCAGFAVLLAAKTAYVRWRDRGARKPALLRALLVLLMVSAGLGLLVLLYLGFAANWNGIGGLYFSAVWNQVDIALESPNIWGAAVSFAVKLVVAAVVIVVIGGILLSSSGGQGSGAASGGGAPSAPSFASSGSKEQTVYDRYGRKLIEVDDSALFGATKVRDKHGVAIGTVEEGLFGGPAHVRIGDDDIQVRDAMFGGDKIVTRDGEEIGRIREDGSGKDAWYERR